MDAAFIKSLVFWPNACLWSWIRSPNSKVQMSLCQLYIESGHLFPIKKMQELLLYPSRTLHVQKRFYFTVVCGTKEVEPESASQQWFFRRDWESCFVKRHLRNEERTFCIPSGDKPRKHSSLWSVKSITNKLTESLLCVNHWASLQKHRDLMASCCHL